ncbi:AraC family transcriptional regulator [Halomonas campaniensis]|uniref:AraC family transcriptional regulator n=1 Tax=Halomonas campaniensis TaxID=213554 RepID=UPI001F0AFF17|nr:AraC family transcriptional regulator [Halomonas campaniensis]
MCLKAPSGDLHSVYRPLICLVLQGAKRLIVGNEERVFSSGQSVLVSADMPVTGRVVQASQSEPYLAIAVELEVALLRELTAHIDTPARSALQRCLRYSPSTPKPHCSIAHHGCCTEPHVASH